MPNRNVVFFISLCFFSETLTASRQYLELMFAPSFIKIRPDFKSQYSEDSFIVYSAKNEFESFQLILRSDSMVNELDIDISDFTNSTDTISTKILPFTLKNI